MIIKFRNKVLLILVSLALLSMLAACNDSATTAPTKTSNTTTTVVTTSTTSNTVASTTNAKTNFSLSIADATEVTLDPAMKPAFNLPPTISSLADLNIKAYASDSAPTDMANKVDAALLAAGYTFNDVGKSGATKITGSNTSDPNSGFGFYVKSGAPDVFLILSSADDLIKNPSTQVDTAIYQKFTDQFKAKKSALILITATGMLPGNAAASNTSSAATVNTNSFSLSVAGATEISIDPALATILSHSVPNVKGTDLVVKIYATDNDLATLAASTDTALLATGYAYNDATKTGATKFTVSAGATSVSGFYTKNGAADIFVGLGPATDLTNNPPPGVDTATYQKFSDQFKNKKNALVVFAATGLLADMKISNASPSATTPGATAIASSSAGGGAAAWTQVDLSGALQTLLKKQLPSVIDVNVALFVSNDEVAKTVTDAQALLTQQGYTCTALISTPQLSSVVCTSAGKLDVAYNITILDDNAINSFTSAGVSADDIAKFKVAAQGKKSIVQLIKGTNLVTALQALGSASNATPTSTP
jgi:hypothetical protein